MFGKQPVLGYAIAGLAEINEDNVRELISFISSQKKLTSMDIDSFCWQVKFVIIENAVVNNAQNDYSSKLGAMILLDCEKLCRELNPLDRVFSEDPMYSRLTPETKGLYRKMTSEISVEAGIDEARLSREYANNERKNGSHIGEIIMADYLRVFRRMRSSRYITSLFWSALLLTILICVYTNWYFLPLVFLPALSIIKPIIDLILSKTTRAPVPLPQIDLNGEIPKEARTLCVVSTLLTCEKDVRELVKRLEAARLKNRSENLMFCALCDFKGGPNELSQDDYAIIEEVKREFEFREGYITLIRKREFSKTQNCWQGHERKRGAIEALMKLLRCDVSDMAEGVNRPNEYEPFREIIGDKAALKDIKFICALDYDTIPLMDSISELVGIALHPCQKDIGIIVPRITTKLGSSLKTGFSRAMAENGGCAGASSYDSFSGEFYQDCFGEGIFTGKGLINVDLFIERCLNKFPDEQILSHDVLEGGYAKVAYAGDVEFSDSFPETSKAYFKRQHRWLRGDLQNFQYMFNTQFSRLTRWKLADNVRRAVTPIFTLLCFFTALIPYTNNALIITLTALLSILMPFLPGFLTSVIRGRKFSNYRRFYSPVISQTKQLLRQCIMELLLLPKNALISFDAVIRTLWRMTISKKRLLDWTTAAAFDGVKGGYSHMLGATFISLVLIVAAGFFGNIFTMIISIFFLSALPVIIYCDRTVGVPKSRIPEIMRRDLFKNAEQIWRFYEDYVTKEHNYLPPDNVQYSPVYRVTFRTSPTNIGMYLLSCSAAIIMGIINRTELEERVSRTVTTIEKLQKWHGNLCNWYTTDKLEVVSSFVSSVDSGNFVCCLVALNETLKAEGCSPQLIERVEKLIAQTDLKPFYNDARNLFSIGYDLDEQALSIHHYDLLMSESRMLSYYAIAAGQADKRHWRSLGRVMSKKGKYAAPVAWTGTMFEYFMPELLLSSKEGSMEYEALKFSLRCQQQRGRSEGLPFGISESGYYAFDRSLNYQYKAHGVQDIGLKAGLNKEYVVSPYSSFIALSYDPISCYNNLAKLEKLGMCHQSYGFYEAADFTKHRVGSGHAVVKSHMAHHMGMSICGIVNTLYEGKIQKLFLSNAKMKRAEELMEEKIIAGEPVLGTPQRQEEKEMRMNADVLTKFSTSSPRLNALSNGRVTIVTSDIGMSQTFFDNKAMFFPTFDLYRPRGTLFAFIENDTAYPFYNHHGLPLSKDTENCVVFTQNTSEYLCYSSKLRMESNVFLDERRPVEIRSFSATNKSSIKRQLTLAIYLEPALAAVRDISAHPAFMDLFLKQSYNEEEKLFIVKRKDRNSDNETVMAIGFREKEDFAFSFNREEVIERNGGLFSCLSKARDRSNSITDVPSPCLFIKTDINLDAHGKKTSHLLICYGNSEGEVVDTMREMRGINSPPEPSEEIISPLVTDTIYGRITRRVLGSIIYAPKINKLAVSQNTLDIRTLWKFGISGDFPIVIYEAEKGVKAVDSVIEMKKALSLCQIDFDLVILYENEKQRQLCEELRGEIGTEVYLIDKTRQSDEELTLIRACAVLTLFSGDTLLTTKTNRISENTILPINRCKKTKGGENRFEEEKYIIEEQPEIPWCNVLANSRFGTLVSDTSLGFTWALNSRENKLTPWRNDLREDNKGEMLIMKYSNKLYDLIDGSRAIFSPNAADYEAVACEIEAKTSVRVYEKGMGKKVVLELCNNSKRTKSVQIAYYTEPILGVDSTGTASRMIVPEISGNALILRNYSNNSLSGAMTVSADKKSQFLTEKGLFMSGKWDESVIKPAHDLIGAIIIKIELPPRKKEKIKFILAFTQNMNDPLSMERALKRRKTSISLPVAQLPEDCGINPQLNALYKYWLPWQVIGCRMWGRTGFYQNSGAYGFRDQLQDCLAAVYIKPIVAKTQILRCCGAQFPEGDVLHWWHDLITVKKGVRTRYSDDLLWLPYVVADYVKVTGDSNILKLRTHYCNAPLLEEHEHERYYEVTLTDFRENVYQHAKRALEKGYNKSQRGLLLMGGGDWCDGYNQVGAEGKGESVWLTMFYALVAKNFSEIAKQSGDLNYAVELEQRANELNNAVDLHAWDGEYYLRAFYDNGSKMGSRNSDLCKIDLLPQAFSALANLPDTSRSVKSINSALNELYDSENHIIKLFTPPFERGATKQEPGYVMSYPPGVRENGGQYTHAAIWLAMACSELGMSDKAEELINSISPANRGREYKTEPYYLAADVYTNPKAYGRGGWSLYTGSAGWYYKLLRDFYKNKKPGSS
ncbi:MAG: hypothetical protein FWD34_04230 [Oscillospiraceae bacterium]|nr:hypothetical protein [Oscillospiraceae bacterium]